MDIGLQNLEFKHERVQCSLSMHFFLWNLYKSYERVGEGLKHIYLVPSEDSVFSGSVTKDNYSPGAGIRPGE